MPRNPTQSPFTGQSLRGMELDVKAEAQGVANWAPLFSATALDVQVAAATTSRQHTLNVGSRTSTGAAGEITATCDVFVVPDSPGQRTINDAFRSGAKVDIRRTLFADKLGTEVTLADTSTKEVQIQIALSPATGDIKGPNASAPKAGGLLTATDAADTKTELFALMQQIEPGMTIQVGSNNYFVGYRAPDLTGTAAAAAATANTSVVQLYISPSPDDNGTPTATSTITGYPYIGSTAITEDSGTLKVFRGRVEQTLYKGTVTVPIVATDAAPGDDGNDLSTSQISFALDDIGDATYDFPS